MEGLQQALNRNSGKADTTLTPKAKTASQPRAQSTDQNESSAKPPKEKKEYTGAWLNPDFSTSLRMVQLRRRKGPDGKKVFLDDLVAEALNDLFAKYDVPTVRHD